MNGRVAVVLAALLMVAPVATMGVAAHDGTHGTTTATPAGGSDCGFPVTRTDATGTEVTVEERPTRVVTLSPSAAQTLWDVGARDRVVGVTEFAGYLNGSDDLPRVNTGEGGFDVERIVALEPDLVLAPGTVSNETVASLRERGLPVFALETPATVDGVATKTGTTGRLVGECQGARRAVQWMLVNLGLVSRAVENESRPDALYVLGGGFTAGNGTFVDDVFEQAGVSNVAADAGVEGFARISPEVVRERDPEWIVRTPGVAVPDDPAYRETTAVRESRTVVVDANYMNQPAPRSVVRAVHALAVAVHPGAAENLTLVPRATFGVGPSTERPSTATTEPTGDDGGDTEPTVSVGPGFGLVAAPVALLVAAALAVVRRQRA